MSDQVEVGDLLDRAVRALQHPMPLQPNLAVRTTERRQRHARRRVAVGISLVVVLGVISVTLPRRSPGKTIAFDFVAPSVRSVALVGDFTNWRTDLVQLRPAGAGRWHATLKLRPGQYRFAYLVDDDEWRADAQAASAPDDFGRPTSVVTVREN